MLAKLGKWILIMKHTFTQHIPNCVDISDRISFEFDTLDELANSEYVQRFAKKEKFSHLAKSIPKWTGDSCRLMTVEDGGDFWWVVGFITNHEDLDLPIWT